MASGPPFAANDNEDDADRIRRNLDWSAKQSRILTASNDALRYYEASRGFPFADDELPHHHLEQATTRAAFERWIEDAEDGEDSSSSTSSLLCGAWNRPLFVGEWEHSTSDDDVVYNVVTRTLFVDVRMPTVRPVRRWENLGNSSGGGNSSSPLDSMTDDDLRRFARQHAFAGYGRMSPVEFDGTSEIVGRSHLRRRRRLPACTRHHCIDWNYIPGHPRPRPNKWYVEMRSDKNVWKEWSYATDNHGQSYYWERWERLPGDEMGEGTVLAMRRAEKREEEEDWTDGIVVVVGDHFNYIHSRRLVCHETPLSSYPAARNLVELVDAALDAGDRNTAVSFLGVEAGHGRVSSGWQIDSSLRPWRHGSKLFENNVRVEGDTMESCRVVWDGRVWDVLECSLAGTSELDGFLNGGAAGPSGSRL